MESWKFFLGAITSRLGLNYVHACTEAVEEVIVKHYEYQIKYLEKKRIDENLKKKLLSFVLTKMNTEKMQINLFVMMTSECKDSLKVLQNID